jgi:hypothetical protein
MTKHPRQREMWGGLTGAGCLTVLVLFVILVSLLEFIT